MAKDQFIRSAIANIHIATLYLREGSGMGTERSVLQNVYIAATSNEIEAMIVADYDIKDGNLWGWVNYNHATLHLHFIKDVLPEDNQ